MAPKNPTKFWCSVVVLVVTIGLAIWACVKAYRMAHEKEPHELIMEKIDLLLLVTGTILYAIIGCKFCHLLGAMM